MQIPPQRAFVGKLKLEPCAGQSGVCRCTIGWVATKPFPGKSGTLGIEEIGICISVSPVGDSQGMGRMHVFRRARSAGEPAVIWRQFRHPAGMRRQSSTGPFPQSGELKSGSRESRWLLSSVVEDDSQRMAAPRPDVADAVAKPHAIVTLRASVRPTIDGKDHGVALG